MGAVQDRLPISSCMRSTTTGMDIGGGSSWRFRERAWSPCLVEAHQPGAPPPLGEPLCSQRAGLATPPITPWWPCSLPAPTGGPSPLVHPYPASPCEAKLCSVMVFHATSKTVGQTPPPSWDGGGRRPCGVGKSAWSPSRGAGGIKLFCHKLL